MGWRIGAVAAGMVAIGAAGVALSPGAGSAVPPAPIVVVHGAVSAEGLAETSGPWTVWYDDEDSYQLDLGEGWPDVEVTGWDVPDDVVVVPLGQGRVVVRFGEARRVESRFTFTAVVDR